LVFYISYLYQSIGNILTLRVGKDLAGQCRRCEYYVAALPPDDSAISSFNSGNFEILISLPLSTIPPLHKQLIRAVSGYDLLGYGATTTTTTYYETTYHRTYCLLSTGILIDIQHIMSLNNLVEFSDDTIDRRLDEFLLQFRV
jgi:hypothetical protein